MAQAFLPARLFASLFAMRWRGMASGSENAVNPGSERLFETADQHIDGLFREALAHRAGVSADIGAGSVSRRRGLAERPGFGEFVQRFLLQPLGVELDRLDLVAEGFLPVRIKQGHRTFELPP